MEIFLLTVLGIGLISSVITAESSTDTDEVADTIDEDDYLEVAKYERADNDLVVDGGDGQDTLIGMVGRDATLLGGPGDDVIRARDNDYAEGGDGADFLDATGHSVIKGGQGDDTLDIYDNSAGYGGLGDDFIALNVSGDGIFADGGEGNDTILVKSDSFAGSELTESIYLGEGEDALLVSAASETSSMSNAGIEVDDFVMGHDKFVVDCLNTNASGTEIISYLSDIEVNLSEDGYSTDINLTWRPPENTDGEFRQTITLKGVSDFDVSDVLLTNWEEGEWSFETFGGEVNGEATEGERARYFVIGGNGEMPAGHSQPSTLIFSGADQNNSLELKLGDGAHLVHLGGGADQVEVKSGNVRIWGGAGDDTIDTSMNDGDVIISGGAGNDTVQMRMGQHFRGGDGEETVQIQVQLDDENLKPALIAGLGGGEIEILVPPVYDGEVRIVDELPAEIDGISTHNIFVGDLLIATVLETVDGAQSTRLPLLDRVTVSIN